MSDENKTTFKGYKWPAWFLNGLEKAKEKEPFRTETEILMKNTMRGEKIKAPKGHKFVKPRITKR